MTITYTKLFSSITESTIWCEDSDVRIVWITLLAMSDRYGFIHSSIPGLANRAQVSLEKTQVALQKFKLPDEFSRTKDFDGRRIDDIEGGWVLLNHEKYRNLRDDEERKAYKRDWIKNKRDREKENKSVDKSVDNVDRGRPPSTHADTYTNTNTKDLKNNIVYFDDFWKLYPRRDSKKKAKKIWGSRKLDKIHEKIFDDLKTRNWPSDKKFIPLPTTYLNGERWNDESRPDENNELTPYEKLERAARMDSEPEPINITPIAEPE